MGSVDTTRPPTKIKYSHISFWKGGQDMPTPPKPYLVLKAEKKSHRTKAELKLREEGEKALVTGAALKERPEVKSNPVAHKEFLRLNKLLKAIGKNDAIYEAVINRYCLLQGECADYENTIMNLKQDLEELKENRHSMDRVEYYKLKNDIEKLIDSKDRQLQTKRKMLFDIERDNCLTIAAALRSIPKKAEKNENPLLKALNGS